MKRYVIALAAGLTLVAVYHFQDRPALDLELLRKLKDHLMIIVTNDPRDQKILLLNTGQLDVDRVAEKIDSLVMLNPKKIGVNYCHDFEGNIQLQKRLANNSKVVFCNCAPGKNESSRLVDRDNQVRYYRTDRQDFFESYLVDDWTRATRKSHQQEVIPYSSSVFFSGLLKDIDLTADFSSITLLVANLGDFDAPLITTMKTAEVNYPNARITTLNKAFGEDYAQPDMHDIMISANIISAVNENKFITEVPDYLRVTIILLFLMLDVTLMILLRTKWLWLNVLLAGVYFLAINVGAGAIMVWIFQYDFFMSLDELSFVLLVVSVFMLVMDVIEKRRNVPAVGENNQ